MYLVQNATKIIKHLEICGIAPVLISMPIYTSGEDKDEPSVIVGSQKMLINPESLSINQCHAESVKSSYIPFSFQTSDIAPVSTSSCSKLHSSKPVFRSSFDSMSKAESEKLDPAFAKAVYSSNLPLSLTDNSCWQLFFKHRTKLLTGMI